MLIMIQADRSDAETQPGWQAIPGRGAVSKMSFQFLIIFTSWNSS